MLGWVTLEQDNSNFVTVTTQQWLLEELNLTTWDLSLQQVLHTIKILHTGILCIVSWDGNKSCLNLCEETNCESTRILWMWQRKCKKCETKCMISLSREIQLFDLWNLLLGNKLIQITVICYYLYDGLGAPCTGHVRLCTDDSDTNTTGSTLLDVLGGDPPIGSTN